MPRPHSVFDLVAPSVPDFRVHGWELNFGVYKWFYIAGYYDAMMRAGIFNLSDLSQYCAAAVHAVPQVWKDEFRNGKWDEISPSQIRTRAVKKDTLCFDKACLSILCLEAAVADRAPHIDIYDIVKIRPAMFRIEDFLSIYNDKIKTGIISRNDLLNASSQKRGDILKDMADGYAVTYRTAHPINSIVNSNIVSVDSRRFVSKNGKKLPMSPSKSETIVHP